MEQFADGDGSFRSDCSMVKKVLKPKGSTGLSPMIKSQISEQPAALADRQEVTSQPSTKAQDDVIPSVSDVEENEADKYVERL